MLRCYVCFGGLGVLVGGLLFGFALFIYCWLNGIYFVVLCNWVLVEVVL